MTHQRPVQPLKWDFSGVPLAVISKLQELDGVDLQLWQIETVHPVLWLLATRPNEIYHIRLASVTLVNIAAEMSNARFTAGLKIVDKRYSAYIDDLGKYYHNVNARNEYVVNFESNEGDFFVYSNDVACLRVEAPYDWMLPATERGK